MQWGKVKNILLAILLAVNLFLAGNLGLQAYSRNHRASELLDNLNTLLGEQKASLEENFSLPQDKALPLLYADRSRADEQLLTQALLGEVLIHEENEGGVAFYQCENGAISFSGDGTIEGVIRLKSQTPQTKEERLATVEKMLSDAGLLSDDIVLLAEEDTITVTGSVARLPVHNRRLAFYFSEKNSIRVTGRWSFGTPYTTTTAGTVNCSSADALLAFAAEQPGSVIDSMELGYRLEEDDGRRLQLAPTWKISTEKGAFLVDCAKKTTVT